MTLSKSLGAQGGAVLGHAAIRDHLIDTGRSMIFDTGLNPAAAGAALRSAQIILAEPELSKAVLKRAAELAAAAEVRATDSAVIPVIIGDAQQAYDRSIALRDKGVHVGCFRPPSVPAGTARLRVTARATLTDAEVERFRSALAETSAR
jgi:8-amino-7-oxononanoate synthase